MSNILKNFSFLHIPRDFFCLTTNDFFTLFLSAERDILEKIDSPFIVKLHYAFQTPAKLYFVMDFLNGGELFYHLRKDQKFSERRACFYAA